MERPAAMRYETRVWNADVDFNMFSLSFRCPLFSYIAFIASWAIRRAHNFPPGTLYDQDWEGLCEPAMPTSTCMRASRADWKFEAKRGLSHGDTLGYETRMKRVWNARYRKGPLLSGESMGSMEGLWEFCILWFLLVRLGTLWGLQQLIGSMGSMGYVKPYVVPIAATILLCLCVFCYRFDEIYG